MKFTQNRMYLFTQISGTTKHALAIRDNNIITKPSNDISRTFRKNDKAKSRSCSINKSGNVNNARDV
jgi:hypothetical protein